MVINTQRVYLAQKQDKDGNVQSVPLKVKDDELFFTFAKRVLFAIKEVENVV